MSLSTLGLLKFVLVQYVIITQQFLDSPNLAMSLSLRLFFAHSLRYTSRRAPHALSPTPRCLSPTAYSVFPTFDGSFSPFLPAAFCPYLTLSLIHFFPAYLRDFPFLLPFSTSFLHIFILPSFLYTTHLSLQLLPLLFRSFTVADPLLSCNTTQLEPQP